MSESFSLLNPGALWHQLGLARHNWPGRFTILLATILLLLACQPIFLGHALAQNFATVSICLVLLSALWAFRTTKVYFTIALILIVPAIGCRLAMQITANPGIELFGLITACLFLTVTVFALVTRLFTVESVTLDTISAAICAYLLMGVGWAYAYTALALRDPSSFTGAANVGSRLATIHSFTYYSFVCMTTTGYGDIVAASEGARSLSVIESVSGQLYMAILIARLVGLQVAQSMRAER